jgi:hypothetical protein
MPRAPVRAAKADNGARRAVPGIHRVFTVFVGQPRVFDRQGDHAEVDFAIEHRFEGAGAVGANDIQRDREYCCLNLVKTWGSR